MKSIFLNFSRALQGLLAIICVSASISSYAVVIPPEPLSIQATSKPMIMLGLGRDHRLYYEAYNDASDIDGDGTLDIRFKPFIAYLGLFDSTVCYSHNNASDNTGLFTPASSAVAGTTTIITLDKATNLAVTKIVPVLRCPGSWSGNWLNYVTTSRIDALRVVLYGGLREVDSSSQTILRRAYIPQDAHSWAKEYTSEAVDGFKITDYTPWAQPLANRRHFFGSVTPNGSTKCDPLETCSNMAPWLSVVTDSSKRVWEWASTERPVLADGTHGGTRTNRTVRVEVCTSAFNLGCKLYPSGNYKPVGLLHDFGENDSALFGLISGSYDSHLSGGRLRKVMSSFKNELNTNNGVYDSSVKGIVHNMNQFRIFGFNRASTSQLYQGGVVGNRPVNQGEFPDWGNPVAELMYEATRYFANKGAPTSAFIGSNTIDDLMGLSRPDWDRPYTGQGTSTANAPYCARANLLTISDTNISFDSNQLPGVNTNFGAGISTDLSGKHISTGVTSFLNVSTVGDFITGNETGITGPKFIGQSGATSDSSPSVKTVGSLSSIRGLAPEEPTKQGSYYSASVAHYAKVNDLNSVLTGNQTVDNFVVALASPLPRIEAKLPNGKVISLLPFAKSVGGAFSITENKTAYQPTNQIVDFYVESIANSGPADANTSTNGGRYEAKFRINYEDVEQGNDHDMDAIVTYTIRANANNTLDVILQPIYQAGGVQHRMGYVISGTTNDGIYLVTQDESESKSYFLNVPPGRSPGYCDQATPPLDCFRLPYLGGSTTVEAAPSLANATSSISRFTFSPSAAAVNTFLKDPLWYAAKWGGFVDINNDSKPDIQAEWDADGDGQPDNYFFVQNPTKLRESLTKAFKSIVERKGSSSNLASNASGRIDTNSLVYRASYVSGKWTGNVEALPVTKTGIGTTPLWRAQDKLPTWNSRKLFMNSGTNTLTMVDLTATAFGSLPALDQTNLSTDDIYSYIKGSKSKEISNGGTLRTRESILGDIIHSSPSYDLDSNTLYVGSNGGFLHSFNGLTGVENFGFIPQAVVPRLKNLSSTAYPTSHEYFVDGDTLLGLKLAQSNKNYYLYTLLGRGGKGLFSINPGPLGTTPTSLWEYTPQANTAAAADPDLGLMLSSPAIMLLNNGKLGIAVGNGYNSTSTKAVLYIFIINPDGTLFQVKKLDTGVAGDNGMAGPAGFDATGDGKTDFIYAGDLKGNLWKFDVRNSDPDKWALAYAGGVPMFKATDSNGNPQPITSAIAPVYNNYSSGANAERLFLFFGTGSYFKVGDNNDLSIQSWYGVVDDETGVNDGTPVPTSSVVRSAFTKRAMSDEYSQASPLRSIRYAGGDVTNDMNAKRGWYYDFDNPVNGERMVSSNVFLPDAIKPALQATSIYPINNNVCVPGGDSWLNGVDPFTGANLKAEFFISAGPQRSNPTPLTGSQHTGLFPSSIKLGIGIATTPINLGTSGTNSTIDPWIPFLGSGYGAGKNDTAISDFKRYLSRVAIKTAKPYKDCAGTIVTAVSGSEGIVSTTIAGCASDKLRGRISWREILKD